MPHAIPSHCSRSRFPRSHPGLGSSRSVSVFLEPGVLVRAPIRQSEALPSSSRLFRECRQALSRQGTLASRKSHHRPMFCAMNEHGRVQPCVGLLVGFVVLHDETSPTWRTHGIDGRGTGTPTSVVSTSVRCHPPRLPVTSRSRLGPKKQTFVGALSVSPVLSLTRVESVPSR